MEGLDLNIDNYQYDDILKLFELESNFGEQELKRAKKKVLMMHPDKSGLDKKYFLFFSGAFKTLHSVYVFREKASVDLNEEVEYLAEKSDENQELIDKLRDKYSAKDFNVWFNKEFDKLKVENEYESNGYGEWLKNEDEVEVCKNQKEMNEMIDKKKRDLRSLVNYNGINEFNNSGYNDLANNKPEEYSSGMFSKLQFEDLKKAHIESVIPVTEDDFKQKYNSIEDIRFKRQEQNLIPLSEKEGREYLNNKKTGEDFIGTQRAFKLATQEREVLKGSNDFWSSLKQIK
jgi:molybdopterin converting factor small subunit